jgi:tetratricopeptide (TPR) repeat protein
MYGLHLRFTSSPGIWLAAGAIVLGLLALALLGKKSFVFVFAAAFIALPLLPALYAMRFSPNIEMVADRYLYLPSVGICLVLGWLAKRMLASRRRAMIMGVASLAAVFGFLCVAQEGFYANQAANFARAAEFAPGNQWVLLQLANAYAKEGKYDESLAQYQDACAIDGNLDCVAGLAEGFYFTHRYAEALPRLQTIARLLDHTDSGHNPTTLVQHEEYLIWLADTERQLGNSAGADETAKRAQAIASEIYAKPEANALAGAFKIPVLPSQVSR